MQPTRLPAARRPRLCRWSGRGSTVVPCGGQQGTCGRPRGTERPSGLRPGHRPLSWKRGRGAFPSERVPPPAPSPSCRPGSAGYERLAHQAGSAAGPANQRASRRPAQVAWRAVERPACLVRPRLLPAAAGCCWAGVRMHWRTLTGRCHCWGCWSACRTPPCRARACTASEPRAHARARAQAHARAHACASRGWLTATRPPLLPACRRAEALQGLGRSVEALDAFESAERSAVAPGVRARARAVVEARRR